MADQVCPQNKPGLWEKSRTLEISNQEKNEKHFSCINEHLTLLLETRLSSFGEVRSYLGVIGLPASSGKGLDLCEVGPLEL